MQALLAAKWPMELQYHPKSCIRQMSQLLPTALPAERAPSASCTAPHEKGVTYAHRINLRQLCCKLGPNRAFVALT